MSKKVLLLVDEEMSRYEKVSTLIRYLGKTLCSELKIQKSSDVNEDIAEIKFFRYKAAIVVSNEKIRIPDEKHGKPIERQLADFARKFGLPLAIISDRRVKIGGYTEEEFCEFVATEYDLDYKQVAINLLYLLVKRKWAAVKTFGEETNLNSNLNKLDSIISSESSRDSKLGTFMKYMKFVYLYDFYETRSNWLKRAMKEFYEISQSVQEPFRFEDGLFKMANEVCYFSRKK